MTPFLPTGTASPIKSFSFSAVTRWHGRRIRGYARLSKRFSLPALSRELRRVRNSFYLPKPREDGLIPQDDSYLGLREIDLSRYRNADVIGTIYNDYNSAEINAIQVTKQADVVLLLNLFSDCLNEETRRRNYEY